MSAAAIVIETSAREAASPYVQTLLDACSHGSVPDLACGLALETEREPPAILAVVSWDDERHLAVSIQVGRRQSERAEWSTRHLVFSARDRENERWRTVGIVIATLAGQVRVATPPATKVTKTERPATRVVAPRAPQKPKLPNISEPSWLGAGFRLSRGSLGALGAAGGELSWVDRPVANVFLLSGSFHFATERANGVELRWLGGAVGGGVSTRTSGAGFQLETHLELGLTSLHAASFASDQVGSSGGMLWSLRETIGVGWWGSRWFGIFVSGELSEANRRAVARLVGQGAAPERILSIERLGWGLVGGVRVRLF